VTRSVSGRSSWSPFGRGHENGADMDAAVPSPPLFDQRGATSTSGPSVSFLKERLLSFKRLLLEEEHDNTPVRRSSLRVIARSMIALEVATKFHDHWDGLVYRRGASISGEVEIYSAPAEDYHS